MPTNSMRAVTDTNVLFEGLTKQGGSCGLIVDAWLDEKFCACTSVALEYEYRDVLGRKLSAQRWQVLRPVLGLLLDLAEPITVYYSWRPASPDPGDDMLIDCAMNASAVIVSYNVRDLREAEQQLGVKVMTPPQFVTLLAASLAAEQAEDREE